MRNKKKKQRPERHGLHARDENAVRDKNAV